METERLIIRDNQKDDLEDLHELLSNKKNMYFLDDLVTETYEETEKNLEHAIKNEDGHYFCITLKTNDRYVGQAGYTITDINPLGKIVHLGYFILPEFAGKGYTTEAVKKVLEFAFIKDSCIRVTTGCYSDNVPSRKIMEKVGFRKEGEHIKAHYHDGKMKDRLSYAINIDDFYCDNEA